MNTNTVHYKGFDIYYTATGKFAIMPNAVGFNLNGYATMNNAKGAITKHLNARDAKHDAGMVVLAAAWAVQDAEVRAIQSRRKREGKYVGHRFGRVVRQRVESATVGSI